MPCRSRKNQRYTWLYADQAQYLNEQQLLEFLVSKLGFSYANLRNYVIDPL